ncbi:hypothetical protein FGB62_42g311 [Gracilaria domingensis]|nr:hypothetical protein FGB62_42g311 [Gracilaria domingensis]
MALNTNLTVPIFNVLKYLLLTLAIDVLVRGGLNSFEHFHRRRLLYYGQSVQFKPVRIDRYNLLHRVRIRYLPSSLILLFITLAAYAVEIGLEFATDSSTIRVPIAGEVTRVNFTRNVCSVDTILFEQNANRLAHLAEKCVVHDQGTYKLYRPIWTKSPEDSYEPLCEQTPGNLLDEGQEIYKSFGGQDEEGKRELAELKKSMESDSYRPNVDENLYLLTFNITLRDVLEKYPHSFDSDHFTTAVFIHRLEDSETKCFGSVYGRRGEGMMRVMMMGCTNGFTSNSSLAYAQGTGLIEMDVEDIDKEWSALVAAESRRELHRFGRGVIEERLQTNFVAYAVFLAAARAQEKTNVNKYAMAYRNCEKVSLPSRDGGEWKEVIESKESAPRIVATVQLWAIILVACWVVVVTAARFFVHAWADGKGMPKRLIGEQEMVCLWLHEKDREKAHEAEDDDGVDVVQRCKEGFLSVEEGRLQDTITATKRARDVERDWTKSFAP